MHRMDLSPNVGEDDLHAVVDGQLAADRHREVMAYLATYPDAADRVAGFFRQRVELAALREGLADGEPGRPQLANLEEALTRVVRQQHRVRRAVGAGGVLAAVLAVAAASGWWYAAGRDPGPHQDGTRLASPAAEGRLAAARDLLAAAEPAAGGAEDAAVLWLQAQVAGHPLKQPDLEALGLRFAGASKLKGARGPAIRLAYTDEEGNPFHVFVGVKESGVELAAALVAEDHVSLSWQQDPLVFSLVAPRGSARLGEVVRSAGEMMDPAPVAADAGLSGGGAAAAAVRHDVAGEAAPAVALPEAAANAPASAGHGGDPAGAGAGPLGTLPPATTTEVSKPL
jgi:anti-sigma factor RsiW